MLRLSSLNKGTVIAALIASFCLVDSIQAQGPGQGAAAPVRSTVVAGVAGEATPITKKKYVGNVEAIEEVDSVARVAREELDGLRPGEVRMERVRWHAGAQDGRLGNALPVRLHDRDVVCD